MKYRVIDLFFNVVFTLELLLRAMAFRSRFLKVDGWPWNVFDAVIVVFGWTHEIINAVFTGDSAVIENVGVIRLLRLGRVARLVRMVRLIPELKSMVYLIMASMSSFFWALVLMLIVIYCTAVYFTEMAGDLMMKGEDHSEVALQWGSIFQSILSLYMAVTGGDDWRNFVDPFKTADPTQYILTTFVFSVYIAFATLVMLNLVTGVFVEGAQRIIKEDKDIELMNMAAKLFIDADDDDSQDITLQEWTEQLNMGNLDEYIRAVGISRAEAGRLFDLLDMDGSGTVNIAEFVRGCLRLRGPAKAMDMADMLLNMKRENFETHKQILSLQAAVQQIADSHFNRSPRTPKNRSQSSRVRTFDSTTQECLV